MQEEMTMVLAECLVRRDMRLTNKKPLGLDDINNYLERQAPSSKWSVQVQYIRKFLRLCTGWSYEISQTKKEARWELYVPTENRKLERFVIKLTKKDCGVHTSRLTVSFHALARIIYRRKLVGLSEAVDEVRSIIPALICHTNEMVIGEEINLASANGIGFFIIDKENMVTMRSWINGDLARKKQVREVSSLYSVIRSRAEGKGLTIREFFREEPMLVETLVDYCKDNLKTTITFDAALEFLSAVVGNEDMHDEDLLALADKFIEERRVAA